MSESAAKETRRKIRRAIGPQAAALVSDHDQAIRVLAEVLTRGFFGRLKWLLTGK